MANFLESLGLSGSGGGIDVYVAISASGMAEMALLDSKSNDIQSYAQLPIEYNESLREIENHSTFAKVIEELFNNCNINPQKANVHLTVPTVWFGYKENVPLIFDENAVKNVVIGELEQSYIFKRKEPLPYWFDATAVKSDNRNIFYTAIQEDAKELFDNTFSSLGAKLISITCSLFTDLRGLIRAGIVSEQANTEGYLWNLLIINNSGFQLYGMKDKHFVEYVEEPLALKTYEGEEAYSAINNAVQISLMGTGAGTLVILSETDLVSADYLSKNLQFEGNIIPVDDNKYKESPFMDLGLNVISEVQTSVSLSILGLISPTDILPVHADFLEDLGIKKTVIHTIEIPISGSQKLILTPKKALIYSGAILGVVLLPLLLLFGIVSHQLKVAVEQNEQIKNEISAVEAELRKYENQNNNTGFDPVKEIERVLKNNRTKIMAYASLGESIPKNLYLTYFMTGDDGYIDIKGSANSVEDVYVFFKNLKDALYDSNLRLNKLDLKTGSLDSVINSDSSSIDDAPYIFEITNMSNDQLSSFIKALRSSSEQDKKDKKE